MGVPAVVAAGDRGAAKAIHGESKAYLEVGGESLVHQIVRVLQAVPEISEVFVVGDHVRLERELLGEGRAEMLRKPLSIVPQFQNLYENAWQSYRRLLPDAGDLGRDPESEADLEQPVLYLSADLPFATAGEIGDFVARGLESGDDYVLGLVTEASLVPFYPEPGKPGIRMAYFNLREGRFRQSNLHLVKPARLGHRHYIEEMYEHRYQRQLGTILGLAWKLLVQEGGGVSVLWYYLWMHLAGVADRRGWRGAANLLRRFVSLSHVEKYCGQILSTKFKIVVTEAGGCGLDVDNEEDLAIARERLADWIAQQEAVASALYGPPALPGEAGAPVVTRVLPEAVSEEGS